jgi:hypothetical protein|tara:strand:- start:330 stop:518 length:189 start_codon:yes stop_codon:yes gene_type:complete
MDLKINDYKVLLNAIENISIKGSNAIYIAGLINKITSHIQQLEIESQEEINLDLPKLSKPKK